MSCGNEGGCGCGHPSGASDREILVAIAVEASALSTCVKTKTGAVIVKNGMLLSTGQNKCAPEGCEYGDKVEKCPREGMKTGTGYELCKPVHAEVAACLGVRTRAPSKEEMSKFAGHLAPSQDEIRAAFTPEELEKLNGAALYLVGHYWACDNCKNFCAAVGITDIQFDKISGEVTRERYEQKGLTKENPPPGSD